MEVTIGNKELKLTIKDDCVCVQVGYNSVTLSNEEFNEVIKTINLLKGGK